MRLEENGFWARLYRDCRRVWIAFIHHKGDPRLYKTDLCTFMRTVLLWAPLAIAFNVITICFALYAVGSLLFILAFELTAVGVAVLILASVGAFLAAVVLSAKAGELILATAKDSETLALAREWTVARKSAICPTIEFHGDKHAAS